MELFVAAAIKFWKLQSIPRPGTGIDVLFTDYLTLCQHYSGECARVGRRLYRYLLILFLIVGIVIDILKHYILVRFT